MPIYHVYRKSDQAQVTGYAAAALALLDEYPLDQFDHVEYVEGTVSTTVFGGRRRVSKLEFIALLGQAAYVTILGMARESVEVEAWVKQIEMASQDAEGWSIDLDDPRTAAGLNAIEPTLIGLGVVESGWAQGVLNG